MTAGDAIILGIVQGLTEFIPVSSTGHLVLTRELFGISADNGLAFDAVLHLATLLAVLIYFRKDIWLLAQTLLRKLSRLPVNPRQETLLYAVIIGSIPAAVLGLTFEQVISNMLRSPLSVAGALIVSAIFFMYAECRYQPQAARSELNLRTGFKIGLFQTLALIPGFSRSGATIAGGMLLGLTRYEAARFAFLLSVPVIGGAGSIKLLSFLTSEETVLWSSLAAGSLASFAVAVIVIHVFLKYLKRNTLWPFIWYKLILAIAILAIFWFS